MLARVVLPLKPDLSFPVLRADNVGTKPSLPWCEGGCGGLERNVAEHCGTPKGLLPGAEMLSGHMREMPRLWRRIFRQRRSEASVLPLPQQAGQGVWRNGVLGSRRTDGTLVPKLHQGLQQLPLELSECL